ncbi:MAG TPA: hypothetical protein VFL38_08400 [Humibacillus xanthopallidus]|nr:hypothetical protein [Humibacillus xanthopallidus]
MSTGEHFLDGLESEVRAELATADSGSALDLFASPESGWLVDPAEVQSEQTGLRSLLGAIQSLEAPRSAPGGPRPEA